MVAVKAARIDLTGTNLRHIRSQFHDYGVASEGDKGDKKTGIGVTEYRRKSAIVIPEIMLFMIIRNPFIGQKP